MSKKADVVIRSLVEIDDLFKVKQLESLVWRTEDTIPVHQTLTAVKNGGLVLGAFLQNELIGFQYSFAGFGQKGPYLCSHMLGIHPDYRLYRIGEQLKHAQAREAAKKGYRLIVWTYDPLESVNGYLNIGKLGAVCSTYIENCYGTMSDTLNRGLPSDRFQVDWHLNGEGPIVTSVSHQQEPLDCNRVLVLWELSEAGYPIPKRIDLSKVDGSGPLYVPVPALFQQIKQLEPLIALDWRLKTRALFQQYFANGWSVQGFLKVNDSKPAVHCYVLDRAKESTYANP